MGGGGREGGGGRGKKGDRGRGREGGRESVIKIIIYCVTKQVKLSKAERDALKLEREKARVEAKAKKEEERR